LNQRSGFVRSILFLAVAAAFLRWLTHAHSSSAQELLFEEEAPTEIVSLNLT
jgi:hypothetical protein